ncbi:MAG: phenylalanine--tRNA ligase subunit alpha [Chloroflexi bacterium]|nr:phenylalanine--tRNA ligase subunit alpha [Chloroflexota bacterium]MQC27884.1 phenylalanine--tRNA ligase subunit alpha [Chloroflexota bacterium]
MTTGSALDRVAEIARQARVRLEQVGDEAALEEWRTQVLGRSGELTQVLRGIGGMEPDERRAVGQAANVAKQELEAALDARSEQLSRAALEREAADGLDVTLPGRPRRPGRLHPVTRTLREILDIFGRMGFAAIEGPEVEHDEYNFGRLRIPEHHPARDMWDTFWFDEEIDGATPLLLRTHTSPMQIRFIEQHDPPVRIVVPGRCYRYEATDATHEWMMQQVEVLAIDEGISVADLKGTLQEFARQMFGPERRVLLRNSYFPFVEPGVELAVDCFSCPGDDPRCPVCRGSGWLEIMGAGMVHPEIIAAAGFDPERYTGFAAGMGVERITMLKYGIEDIRNFYANDLRFLRQF